MLLGFIACLSVNAQISNLFEAEDLIKKTNGKALAVVEQMYLLKDKKGNVYGLNGNEEFGKTYSLGIVTDGGLIVTDKAVHPWNYDPNYDQYKNDKSYEPVLYETDIKSFGEKQPVRMECTEDAPMILGNGFSIMSCFQNGGGLALTDTIGNIEGWMVWAMHPSISDFRKDIEYNTVICRWDANVDADGHVDIDASDFFPPNNGQKAIGGFFVVPNITKAGNISFELCAVAYKDEEYDSWWLQSTIQPKKKAEEKQPKAGKGEEEKPKPSGGKLTPSGKGKKGNKK